MKKFFVLLSALILCACQQLTNGQVQPVTAKDAKNKIMFTTCSGSVEDWASCFRKARSTCSNGYQIIEQKENANGGFRDITFKCN